MWIVLSAACICSQHFTVSRALASSAMNPASAHLVIFGHITLLDHPSPGGLIVGIVSTCIEYVTASVTFVHNRFTLGRQKQTPPLRPKNTPVMDEDAPQIGRNLTFLTAW